MTEVPLSRSTAGHTDFARFIAGLERRLVSYLWSLCGRGADAEDLFQETCIALHGAWSTVGQMERAEAWAFRVAHNLAVNVLKRRGIEKRAVERAVREMPTATGPDPSIERDEVATRVQDAIATLPVDTREAVALKVWGEASWVEIGRCLGISEDAAARLFAKGLRTLAPLLSPLAKGGA